MTLQPRSTAELATIVRDARAQRGKKGALDGMANGEANRGALRFEGTGSWLGTQSPGSRITVAATPVSLAGITGVVSYVPNDLTLTVRAGTTLAELDAITAPNNQWCPLLSWGDDTGTIGATFATATGGPCAATLGRPRDIALGVEFVDGTGAVIRGGGHVVKNVAGFDLTRLLVGSFGSLGAITEVSVRLRARPAVDVTWCVTADGPNAADWLSGIRRGTITPFACEPVSDGAARSLGLPLHSALVRFGGNAAVVAEARAQMSALGTLSELDAAVWTRFRALDPHPRKLDGRPLSGGVARRIKDQFDPSGIMNPGVFGEGA